jgi:hypothetical protein
MKPGKGPMTDESAEKPFNVRSTVPGRWLGIKEWSPEELDRVITSYPERYPDQWRAYLDAENNEGFIANAMNDHILAHIVETFPGYFRNHGRNKSHYRAGVVDFRFANEKEFHFEMWQPEKRLERMEKWSSRLKARVTGVTSNGTAEWTDQQVDKFMNHLEEKEPGLWAKFCEIYNNLGFSDLGLTFELRTQVSIVFPVPEDIDYSSIIGGLIQETDRRYGLEMVKPENQKKMFRLQEDWLSAEEARTPFDEWRQKIKLQGYSQ